MLYDPKWKVQTTKPDVFSLESLIAWLEKQPADETYCYINSGRCLLCQYFGEAFGKPTIVTFRGYRHSVGDLPTPYPDAFHQVAIALPWTFDTALTRARAALAEERT